MGIIISLLIILSWTIHLIYCLLYADVSVENPFMYLHILLQAYLFTGLFITAHDSMHKNISANLPVNKFIGTLCSFLFAALSYKKLFTNHIRHHSSPGTPDDPDFYTGSRSFLKWWFVFLKRYITIRQIIYMAVIFNLLKIFSNELSIWIFFVLPVLLSSFQLFFFGTYLPHRTPHSHDMKPHNSRTQNKNHMWAMISCYFFGYHSEHHHHPHTPWWQLYKFK